MKLDIRVIPGAKKALIKEENGILKVYVNAPAVENKANQAVIKILAAHFNVKKRNVEIIKGLQSRNKTVIISD